jgi:hypothetical protein
MNMSQLTTGRQMRPQRLLIYGVEGIGKSTLASQFPRPVFLDVEDRTSHLEVMRWTPKTWFELLQCIATLRNEDHDFCTVVLDTADWAEQLATAQICTDRNKTGIEDFGYGKGYTYLKECIQELMQELHELQYKRGMHVVILAHAKIKRFDDPQLAVAYDRYQLKCSEAVSALFREWCDAVLFANYETVTSKGEDKVVRAKAGRDRVLYCQHTAAYDAKNSYGLPDEIPMEYEHLRPYIEIGFDEHITYTPAGDAETKAAKLRAKNVASELAAPFGGDKLLLKLLEDKGTSFKKMTVEECELFIDEVREVVTTKMKERDSK